MFKKILIANDGSEGAFMALVVALRLAHSHKAQLHMICVEEILWMPAGSREELIGDKELADRKFAEVVAKAEAEAKHHRVKLRSHVLVGHAVPTIVEFIERDGFDLLITGFMGHSALYNRVIGSTTDRLVELAPCAVLVVK
jgi:nucleotide-binding universal stress UspA family protein